MERFRQQVAEVGRRVRSAAEHSPRRVAVGLVAALVVAGAIVAIAQAQPRSQAKSAATTASATASTGVLRGKPVPQPALRAPVQSGRVAAGGVVTSGGGAAAPAQGASAAGAPAQAQPDVAPPPPAASAVPPFQQKVVKTADLRVRVPRRGLSHAFDRAASIAEGNGGFVAASSTSSGTNVAEATITLRVPAAHFDAVRRALGDLGKVEQQDIQGTDVTGQLVDLDARIRNLQSQEQALQTLMSKARTVGEIIEVQGQLFAVRQQIEELQGQRAQLDDQASYATVQLSLFEPGVIVREPRPQPANSLAHSLRTAGHGVIAVVGGMLIVLGYTAPFVVLVLLGLGVARVRRRMASPVPRRVG